MTCNQGDAWNLEKNIQHLSIQKPENITGRLMVGKCGQLAVAI